MARSPETVELVAGAGVTAAMTIGYIVLVGRMVGPAEYSDFSAALSAIYFVGLTVSPLTPAIARLTAAYRARGAADAVRGLRALSMRRISMAAGAVALAGALASFVLADTLQFRTAMPLVLAFVSVFFYAIVSVDRGVVQGLLLFRAYNANVLVEAAVRLLVAVVLVSLAPTASAALIGYALALVCAELMMAQRLRREVSGEGTARVDWAEAQRVVVPLVLLMFAIAAFQNSDMIAVKRWFAPADAGGYGAATAIARGIGVVFVPFYVVAGPLLTSLHEAGKPVFLPTLRLAGSFLLAVSLPLALIAAAPRFLLSVLYGTDFAGAAPVLAPLAGVSVITYLGLMLGQALITLHDSRFLAGYMVFAALQVAGLALFHETYGEVLVVLYVTQTGALLSVLLFFVHAWRVRRRASPC